MEFKNNNLTTNAFYCWSLFPEKPVQNTMKKMITYKTPRKNYCVGIKKRKNYLNLRFIDNLTFLGPRVIQMKFRHQYYKDRDNRSTARFSHSVWHLSTAYVNQPKSCMAFFVKTKNPVDEHVFGNRSVRKIPTTNFKSAPWAMNVSFFCVLNNAVDDLINKASLNCICFELRYPVGIVYALQIGLPNWWNWIGFQKYVLSLSLSLIAECVQSYVAKSIGSFGQCICLFSCKQTEAEFSEWTIQNKVLR